MELLWEVHYIGGEVVTNLDIEDLSDLPPKFVLGIVNYDYRPGQTRLALQHRRNYYTLVDGVEWWAVDFDGLRFYLEQNIGKVTAVLFGGSISTPNFQLWVNEQVERGARLKPVPSE